MAQELWHRGLYRLGHGHSHLLLVIQQSCKYLSELAIVFWCHVRFTKLDDDLSKVIWMSGPTEEAFIADCRLVALPGLEQIFLYIADALHDKSNGVQYHTSDIPSCSICWLLILRDIWRVENCNWQRDSPDPKHLEDPEPKKGKEFIPFIIKSVVFACFQDSEEEEGRKSQTPNHYKKRSHDLPCIVVTTKRKCNNCKHDEVGSSSEI